MRIPLTVEGLKGWTEDVHWQGYKETDTQNNQISWRTHEQSKGEEDWPYKNGVLLVTVWEVQLNFATSTHFYKIGFPSTKTYWLSKYLG